MTYYVLSLVSCLIIFLLFLIFMKPRKWSYVAYFCGFVLVFTGIFVYAYRVKPFTHKGPEAFQQELILFLCTLGGILTNAVIKRIRGKNFNIRWTDLFKATAAAPCIFLVVWGAVEKMATFSFAMCCFAYTNGYFSDTILKQLKGRFTKSPNTQLSNGEDE